MTLRRLSDSGYHNTSYKGSASREYNKEYFVILGVLEVRRYNPAARLYYATRYSLSGLLIAFREEQAFEYEAAVLAVLLTVVLWAGVSFPEAAVLIGCWLAVMAFELVNGAVERAFDLIDQDRNPHIKAGKDMLSAAVFLMITFNVVLWGIFLCLHRGSFVIFIEAP